MKKVCWIIGASHGIGEALANKFYEENYDVIISSRDLSKLELIKENLLPVEHILQDVAFFDITFQEALEVKQGKKILIHQNDLSLVWLRYKKRIITIGNLFNKEYNIFRNFNLEDLENVDNTRA